MTWQEVWRNGIAPLLAKKHLEALQKALQIDDPRLLQKASTKPPPLAAVRYWPVEAACAIGLSGWLGDDNIITVEDVQNFFAKICYEVDQRMGKPASCRWFLNWFDDTPRNTMRQLLLKEVELSLENNKS